MTLVAISKFIAIATEPLYILILAAIISIILYLTNEKSKAILLASTSLVTALAIKSLKAVFAEPRPVDRLIQEAGYSFPSGHTTFAIVFLGLMVYILAKPGKRLIPTVLAAMLATVIALSRLILKVHFPIDILGGIVLGSIILTASILIHKNSK